jgi:hypothetical protein
MSEEHTTTVDQRYLNELAEDSPAEPIVRALLDRSYPCLTQLASNVQADESLGAAAE